ncbi:hypothetical protein RFX61_18530, partial [Acinetobacter baumannii]|nr:hypothetical protein [Acinetobacter baumannii]
QGTISTLQWEEERPGQVADSRKVPGAFYLRLVGCQKDLKEALKACFCDACFLQRAGQPQDELALVVKDVTEEQM